MNTSIAAQWLKHPTADIPRTADGKPDLAAPAPRQANGKPVLAGLWRPAPGLVGDMTRGMKTGEVVPFQPWAEALFKERRANNSRDDPTARCIVGGVPRSDFRRLPVQDSRTAGHGRHPVRGGARLSADLHRRASRCRRIRIPPGSATRSGDGKATSWSSNRAASTTTSGWTTPGGRPPSTLKVTERFVRKNFGQMDIEITIDDPKAYTKPWTVTQQLAFQPDTELLEYICNENNKYFEIIPKTADR